MSHLAFEMRQRTSDAATASGHEKLAKDAADLDARVRKQRIRLQRELESIAVLIEQSAHKEGNDDFLD